MAGVGEAVYVGVPLVPAAMVAPGRYTVRSSAAKVSVSVAGSPPPAVMVAVAAPALGAFFEVSSMLAEPRPPSVDDHEIHGPSRNDVLQPATPPSPAVDLFPKASNHNR